MLALAVERSANRESSSSDAVEFVGPNFFFAAGSLNTSPIPSSSLDTADAIALLRPAVSRRIVGLSTTRLASFHSLLLRADLSRERSERSFILNGLGAGMMREEREMEDVGEGKSLAR